MLKNSLKINIKKCVDIFAMLHSSHRKDLSIFTRYLWKLRTNFTVKMLDFFICWCIFLKFWAKLKKCIDEWILTKFFLPSWITKLILIEMVRIHENCYFDIKKSQHYLIFEKKSKWRSWSIFTNLHLWIGRTLYQNCTKKIMKFGLVKKSLIFANRKAFIVKEKQVMTFKVRMNETIQ